MSRPKIFLSYSHRDEEARDQLVRFFKPLERAGAVDYWVDTRLSGGDLWRNEIEEALASATVAVLLVSQDFLASDFIVGQEVPPLLEKAMTGGLTLIPVFLSPSSVREVDFALPGPGRKIQLADFQGYGSPQKTLKELTRVERERKYTELAAQLKRLVEEPPAPSPAPPTQPPVAPSLSQPLQTPKVEKNHPGPSDSTSATTVSWNESFRKLWKEKPLEAFAALGGVFVGVPTAVGALGFLALRARETLLGLPALSYPRSEWIVTGADALGTIPWRGFLALTAEHSVVRYSAIGLLALSLTFLVVPAFRRRPVAMHLVLICLSAVILAIGGLFYKAAIQSKPPCPNLLNSGTQAVFEACTWLTTENDTNHQRRFGLGGLLGWLLAATFTAAWTASRARIVSHPWVSRLRRGLVIIHLLLGTGFLFLLPRAYAFGEWGLLYPSVTLRQDLPQCPGPLALALASERCCAIDVSAGSTETILYVRGQGCPNGPISLKTASTAGSECLVRPPTPYYRVIVNGC